MIGWWRVHGQNILDDFGVIARDIGTWFDWMLTHAADFLATFKGIWEVQWGVVSSLFLGVLDLLSGKWAAFGDDITLLFADVIVGLVHILDGLIPMTIDILEKLLKPWNDFMHWLYNTNKGIGDIIYLAFAGVEVGVLKMLNGLMSKADEVINKVKHVAIDALPLSDAAKQVLKDASDQHTARFDVAKIMADTKKEMESKNWIAGALTGGLGLAAPSGLAPSENVVFGRTAAQAKADNAASDAALIKSVTDSYARMTGKTYDQSTGAQSGVQGPVFDPMANLLAEFKKLTSGPGLVLDMSKSDSITKWLGGLLTVPQLTGADTTKAEKAAAVIKEDRAKFEYDLLTGASTKTLKGDIAQIVKDMTAAGSDKYETGIEYLRDLAQIAKDGKKDSSAVLAALNMQFEFDRNVAHPSATTLHKDELAILAEMGRTGSTALQIAREKQILDAQLARGVTTTNATEAGAGRHYFGVNPRDLPGSGAGFGQSLVAFGSGANAQAESVNLLRQQLAAALRREAKDERQIALLEAQLAAETRVADGIRTMLAGDAGGVHRGFKRAGIAHPVAR